MNSQTGKQPIQFKKAVKRDAKGRVAMMGPAGSGKSYTMLEMARRLAGPTGRIAAIDTEHGSLSKYADIFDFDVFELDSYSPENFLASLTAAEDAEYDVFCCDSLSHFWVGKDGALEFVDNALKLAKNRSQSGRADDMVGWKEFRPHEREMVDRMLASRCHVIVTMRTKTAYEEQTNSQGKKVRVKIGLAPVQRDGLEYEFDLVGLLTDENDFVVDKSRCSAYNGRVLKKPQGRDWDAFAEWLKGEKTQQATPPPPSQPQPSGQQQTPANVAQPAQQRPAQQRPAQQQQAAPPPQPPPQQQQTEEVPSLVVDMWQIMQKGGQRGFQQVFNGFKTTLTQVLGEEIGPSEYNFVLAKHGVDSWQKFRSTQKARQCVLALYQRVMELTPDQSPTIGEQPSPSEASAA